MSDRGFRFGIAIPGVLDEAWIAHVCRAEELGFDVVHAADHLRQSPPTVALAAAATVTDRIRLGTYVINNDLRHPAVLAQEIAGLDHLSGGRMELGLGAGWGKEEYASAGLSYDRPGQRIDRMEESARVLKALLGNDRGRERIAGRYYNVSPEAVSQPAQVSVPLLIGGSGSKVLSVAARMADIVSLSLRTTPGGTIDSSDCTVANMERKLEAVRVAAGDRYGELELNIMVLGVFPTDDPPAAAQACLDRLIGGARLRADSQADMVAEQQLTVQDILESPHYLFGTPREMADALRQRRERWDLTYYSALLPAMDSLASVIQELR